MKDKTSLILKKIQNIPGFSPILDKVSKIMEDERASADHVGSLIEKDQALTTRVLKLANSPFYGFPRRVTTIKDAIVLLGFNVVKSLAICSSALSIMEKEGKKLWEHSISVAAASESIAKIRGLKRPEEVSTAALLHDMGKIIIITNFPEEMERIKLSSDPLEEEKRLLGMNHAKIASIMGERWNLPKRLLEPISMHHNTARSRGFRLETCIVHVANFISKILGYDDGIYRKPELDKNPWKLLSLNKEELKRVVRKVEEDMEEAKSSYLEEGKD